MKRISAAGTTSRWWAVASGSCTPRSRRASVTAASLCRQRHLHTRWASGNTIFVSSSSSGRKLPVHFHRPVLLLRSVRLAHIHTTEDEIEPAEVVATHDERELVKRAEELWEQDKTEEAIQTVHQIIAGDPDDYDLIEKLGDMYLAVGNYEASDHQYTQAIYLLESQPSRGLQKWSERMAYLLVKRGESRERSQRNTSFDDAEAEYKRAIEINPQCVEAYHRLGYLNMKEGYMQTAEAAFDKGISCSTERGLITAELYYGKGQIRAQSKKDWRKAAHYFRQACEADSTYAPAYFKLGQILQKDKDWLGAIQAYDKYFDKFHSYYGTHVVDAADQRMDSAALISDVMLRRGACYVEYNDPEASLSDFEAVMAFEHPRFVPLAYLWRGKARFKNSDFWKAIEDYTEAINRDPQLIEAYYERSACYDVVGLTKEAEEDKLKYEQLRRAKSWEARQAMLETHFGPGRSDDDH